jgi:hypothetical protein
VVDDDLTSPRPCKIKFYSNWKQFYSLSKSRSEDAERKCSEEDGINAMVNNSHQQQAALVVEG